MFRIHTSTGETRKRQMAGTEEKMHTRDYSRGWCRHTTRAGGTTFTCLTSVCSKKTRRRRPTAPCASSEGRNVSIRYPWSLSKFANSIPGHPVRGQKAARIASEGGGIQSGDERQNTTRGTRRRDGGREERLRDEVRWRETRIATVVRAGRRSRR